MPYKSEKIKISSTEYDRRRKLSDKDKEEIKELVGMSIRGIARMYGVDKRLIQFILYPERHAKNIADRRARGGSMQYYDKEKNTESLRKYRHYKQQLFLEGKIK